MVSSRYYTLDGLGDLTALSEQILISVLQESAFKRSYERIMCKDDLHRAIAWERQSEGDHAVAITPVAAAFELGRRRGEEYSEECELSSPYDVSQYCGPWLEELDHEEFYALFLNTKNILLQAQKISHGTLDATLVGVREVCKNALLVSAKSIILVHNHPSGDPQPSHNDKELSLQIENAAALFDIVVLDHVIIGNRGRSYSMKSCGDM